MTTPAQGIPAQRKGPLTGLRFVEVGGIGPAPFCCMLLADLGADVVRIDRPPGHDGGVPVEPRFELLNRSRRSVQMNLKQPAARDAVLRMVQNAHVLVEGFRPGVMERLGLGPDDCLKVNPQLVYGRMTGWGQEGPIAQAAGHDINYIALTGALHHIGRAGEAPVPPLNLVGDFGGGGMLLAFGILAALLERQTSGKGQVVDAAMVDGASILMTMFHGMRAAGAFSDERGENLLDTGAHFYNTYETADGKYVSVGSIEPQFYAELLRLSGLESEQLPHQHDKAQWPAMKERLATVFKTKTRDEWTKLMEGTDVCFAPVLKLPEAYGHPQNTVRETFVEVGGVKQPAPAPRFSRTPGSIDRPPAFAGEHTREVLSAWGIADDEISKLEQAGAVRQA